jgi:hypothetical protein
MAPRVGQPEGFRHIVGEIEIAGEVGFNVISDAGAKAVGVDAGFFGSRETVCAEAEAEMAV